MTGESKIRLTGVERSFKEDELIVSKTDVKGRITYANEVFCRVADFTEQQLLGQPHSIVRHPHMPRCVFKLLWDTLAAKQEIFAYVLNMARTGDHYWVLAHVTPSYDQSGQVIGYHSNRRVPRPEAVNTIWPIYQALYAEEQKYANRKEGMQASTQILVNLLEEKGVGYDELVFSL